MPDPDPATAHVRFSAEPEPIYGLWFSKDGMGPDNVMVKVWPVSPMPGKKDAPKPEDQCLGIRFDRSLSPGAFYFGHAPLGAGPMLYRDDVAKLHRALGAWLDSTAASLDHELELDRG